MDIPNRPVQLLTGAFRGAIGCVVQTSTGSANGHQGTFVRFPFTYFVSFHKWLINACSESILEKPSFRTAALKRRGILPADGYYEWQKTEDSK
jgi:putative SOS response-associated peptidase YedK